MPNKETRGRLTWEEKRKGKERGEEKRREEERGAEDMYSVKQK